MILEAVFIKKCTCNQMARSIKYQLLELEWQGDSPLREGKLTWIHSGESQEREKFLHLPCGSYLDSNTFSQSQARNVCRSRGLINETTTLVSTKIRERMQSPCLNESKIQKFAKTLHFCSDDHGGGIYL